MSFNQINDRTWQSGYLTFIDLGRIEGGITHRFEVQSSTGCIGWVVWRFGWRKYVYKSPAYNVDLGEECLTIIAAFVKMQTDERKLHWKGAQT